MSLTSKLRREAQNLGQNIRVGHAPQNRFVSDATDALLYRSGAVPGATLPRNAERFRNMPLSAIAALCLTMQGREVDEYGDKLVIAEQAMATRPLERHTFFSERDGLQASAPAARPGDFPNIMSALANKFLDTIELDDDFSYEEISALLPGSLNDFKPAPLINRGVVEELDEVQDAEQIKQIGVAEEVLSYTYVRRYANKWGLTPVMVANDDLGAFADGVSDLQEAWQVTQNRLVLDRFIANEQLLDGTTLFANRADTGGAANNNDRTSGNPPSDTEWGAMEALYGDIGGVGTGRRVRGTLNVALVPNGVPHQEARRTFNTLNTGGVEDKSAGTTSAVGIYRGLVKVVPDSELRAASAQVWYGLRNPTNPRTATVVRGYFNGYGAGGRREEWYDPNTKTTFISLEGRIAVATKNWRYCVRNAGTGAG